MQLAKKKPYRLKNNLEINKGGEMCVNLLRRCFCFVLVVLLFCLPCLSEKNYTITELQLNNLKKEIETQETLVNEQEKQIENLNNLLIEQNQLLKKSKSNMIETCIIIGGVSFCVGALVTSLIIIGVQNVNN